MKDKSPKFCISVSIHRTSVSAGKTFGPDGLSRRDGQPGDEKYTEDEDSGENNPPPTVILTDGVPVPLDYEDFKNEIDSRGGYLQTLALSVKCFHQELCRSD